MSFSRSKEMKDFTTRLNQHSKTGTVDMWDVYYFCSMIGMSKRKISLDEETKIEFSKNYTNTYAPLKYEIVAAIIATEISRNGLDFSKENITNMFRKFVDDDTGLVLNSYGLKILDGYAEAGFKILSEYKPRIIDKIEFMTSCKEVIDLEEG